MKQISLMSQPECDHIMSVLLIKKLNTWWNVSIFNYDTREASGETSQLCTTASVRRICMSLCV